MRTSFILNVDLAFEKDLFYAFTCRLLVLARSQELLLLPPLLPSGKSSVLLMLCILLTVCFVTMSCLILH